MKRSLVLLLSSLVLVPVAGAQEGPSVADLLSHRASLTAGGYGYHALPLPAEALAIAARDLSDLRIVDGDELVPYAVVYDDPESTREPSVVEDLELPVTNARQSSTTAGGVRYAIETYEVDVPALAWRDRSVLRLETPTPDFTASVRVRTADGTEVARGTIFRLPAIDAVRDTIELPVRVSGPVVVEIRSEPRASAPAPYLTPHIHLFHRSLAPERHLVERPLAIVSSGLVDGAQTIELTRPAGLLPIELRIETTSATFMGRVRVVSVDRDGGRHEVGSGRVLRVTPREADGVVSETTISIDASALDGERLVVTIDRGDSPALEGVEVIAVARQPTLVFDAPSESLVLAFGGGRLHAARYDLASLASDMRYRAAPAQLGPVEPNPGYHPEPALSFAMRAGAPVDRARFAVEAPLSLPEPPEGLARVLLSPALVAAARTDGADLRVLDAEGRQWPYVVSSPPRDVWVELVVGAAEPALDLDRTSRYVLTAPYALDAVEVEVTVGDEFFSRSFVLLGRARPDVADERAIEVGSGWRSNAPGPLLLPASGGRMRGYELLVEDGDEAPLSITAVRARVPITDLLVTAPAGEYTVCAGDPALVAAHYDLMRADPALLANVPTLEVAVGDVRANPAFRAPSMFERAGWEAAALYAVLALAVLFLGALTFRLARMEPEPVPAAAPPGPAPAPAPAGAPGDDEDDSEPAAGDEDE